MKAATTIFETTNIRGLDLKNRLAMAPMTRSRASVSGALLAAPDAATFYTPGSQGYTDYPILDGEAFVGALVAQGLSY